MGTALVLALASAPDGLAARTPGAIPDLTALFGRAVRIVHNTDRPTYSRAVVLEADGITRGGRCTAQGCFGGRGTTTASGVVSWRFVFNNQGSRSRFKSATIFYGPSPKAFGKVTGFKPFFAEDAEIPRTPQMTLRQAVSLLQRAGQRGTFFNVTLRSPLGPKRLHPLYIFGFAHSVYFEVDTVTKKVKRFG